jgi:transposase
MLALEPRVVEAVWQAVQPRLPRHPETLHPLGCHRPRVADRTCFVGILIRLVTGCSWDVAGRLSGVGETTLRRRRDEWLAAGVFDGLVDESLAGYDRIIGLDLTDTAVDASLHKAPFGGEGTGPNPTDRAKSGWKWSLVTDRNGIPFGWEIDGANRNDAKMLAATLDAADARGLLVDIETLHMDRGYDHTFVRDDCTERGLNDAVIARRRPRGKGHTKKVLSLGMRWPVERTNSWLSNFGQLRRNTDRFTKHRLGQLALAVTLIITVKLFKWADRWSPQTD